MAAPTTVYCVFESNIDNEGYLGWNLLCLTATVERAREIISTRFPGIRWETIHPTMNEENRYTFVGTREEVSKLWNPEECNWPSDTRGWVIEAQTLK